MTAAPVTLRLPPVLASLTGGLRRIEARGGTIRAVLDDVAVRHPALALHLFDEARAVRRYIVCIHGDLAVRPDEFAGHAVRPGDEIQLTNALAGG